MIRRGSAEELVIAIGATFVFSVVVSLCLCIEAHDDGWDEAVKETQNEAIEAGVGYWDIDEKTGERSFKWRTPEAENTADPGR